MAHVNAIFHWSVYNDIRDCNDILLCDNEKTYKLLDDMFASLSKTFSSRIVNIGMDEAHMLEKVKDNVYSYLFKTSAALCRVLEKKADLGIKTRKAYKAKDTSALSELIAEYDDVVNRIEIFYEIFEEQWMKENKPHGFDVQDIRIGGLIKRIKHCKKQLLRYINGEISHLEELEEEQMDISNRENGGHLNYNDWAGNVTSNVL